MHAVLIDGHYQERATENIHLSPLSPPTHLATDTVQSEYIEFLNAEQSPTVPVLVSISCEGLKEK